jgi:hypothetical protein
MITDADLAAYADGALDEERRAQVEAATTADPQLATRLAAHRDLRRRLAAAFDPILDEPMPERLTQAIAEPKVVRPRFGWPGRLAVGSAMGGALAASLALGVLLGRGSAEPGDLKPGPDGLRAAGELAQALDRQLAGETGVVRVGFTFAQRDGGLCRTFDLPDGALSGLACRDRAGWAVPVVAAEARAQRGDYRMAASPAPPAVLAAVDARIAGDAFDRLQERAARARGWR